MEREGKNPRLQEKVLFECFCNREPCDYERRKKKRRKDNENIEVICRSRFENNSSLNSSNLY